MRRNREILEYGRHYFLLKIKNMVNRLGNNYCKYISAQKINLKIFTNKNWFKWQEFQVKRETSIFESDKSRCKMWDLKNDSPLSSTDKNKGNSPSNWISNIYAKSHVAVLQSAILRAPKNWFTNFPNCMNFEISLSKNRREIKIIWPIKYIWFSN